MSTTLSDKSPVLGADRGWRIAAIALLAIRFVQGWIYWGGGARRFIAMGVALFLAGSGAYSMDNWLLARKPSRANSTLFRWFGGSLPLPLRDEAFKKLASGLFLIVLAFVVGSYSYIIAVRSSRPSTEGQSVRPSTAGKSRMLS